MVNCQVKMRGNTAVTMNFIKLKLFSLSDWLLAKANKILLVKKLTIRQLKLSFA